MIERMPLLPGFTENVVDQDLSGSRMRKAAEAIVLRFVEQAGMVIKTQLPTIASLFPELTREQALPQLIEDQIVRLRKWGSSQPTIRLLEQKINSFQVPCSPTWQTYFQALTKYHQEPSLLHAL